MFQKIPKTCVILLISPPEVYFNSWIRPWLNRPRNYGNSRVVTIGIFCATTGSEDCDLQRVFSIKNSCVTFYKSVQSKYIEDYSCLMGLH